MSTTTLLQHILLLSYQDKVFIAEQLKHIIQEETLTNVISDNTQNYKELSAAKIPEGYISSEEFWSLVQEDTKQFCKEYGIL